MSDQTPATTPFDASVIDEAAMRALRAVQRSLPQDGGGAGNALAGGTAAAAGAGMMQDSERGGAALPPGSGVPEAAGETGSGRAGPGDAALPGIEIAPLTLPEAAPPPPVATAPFRAAAQAPASQAALPQAAVVPEAVLASSVMPALPATLPDAPGSFTPPPRPRTAAPGVAPSEAPPPEAAPERAATASPVPPLPSGAEPLAPAAMRPPAPVAAAESPALPTTPSVPKPADVAPEAAVPGGTGTAPPLPVADLAGAPVPGGPAAEAAVPAPSAPGPAAPVSETPPPVMEVPVAEPAAPTPATPTPEPAAPPVTEVPVAEPAAPTPATPEPTAPTPEPPAPPVPEVPVAEPAAPTPTTPEPTAPTPEPPTPPVTEVPVAEPPTPTTPEPTAPTPEPPAPPVPEVPVVEPAAPTPATPEPTVPTPEPPTPPVTEVPVAEPAAPTPTTPEPTAPTPEPPAPEPPPPMPEAATPEVPVVTAVAAAGDEDQAIALDLSAQLNGRNWAAVLSVGIVGLPEGAMLSAGTRQADGSWVLTPAQLDGLTLTPPADFAGTLALTLQATAQGADGATTRAEAGFTVQVAAVVDGAPLTAQAAGAEDQWIPLQASFGASTDASEHWAARVLVRGVPAGAMLSGGTDLGDGTWSVERAALEAGQIAIRPPANSDAPIALRLEAVLRDSDGTGAERIIATSLQVQVTAVADGPIVTATDAVGREDSAIALDLSAALRDTDGSETLSLRLLGLPAGATLSAGARQADGSWALTAAQLQGLTLTPPRDFSGTLALTVQATAREAAGGDSALSNTGFTLRVEAGADAPVVTAADAMGREDSAIALDLSAALRDVDGSETLLLRLLGLPTGAVLSAGTQQADGSWALTPAQLQGLTLTPPRDFSGTLALTVQATAREAVGGDSAVSSTGFTLRVEAVADAPIVTAADAMGREDSAIALDLSAALRDTDGSETLSLRLLGLPAGATLSAGARQADGSWALTAAQLQGLTLTPPRDFSGTLALTVQATAREAAGGSSAVSNTGFTLRVEAVADAPIVTAADAMGREDSAIALDLSAALRDVDGSETLSLRLLGLPAGATLSAGTQQADGSWALTPAQLRGLTLTSRDFSGTLALTVQATAREAVGGDSAVSSTGFTLRVAPTADAVTIVAGGDGAEDSWIPLTGTLTLGDTDGSEQLGATLVVRGLPSGALLSHGNETAPGVWSVPLEIFRSGQLAIRPPANSDVDLRLVLGVRSIDEANGVRDERLSEANVTVVVRAVADAPLVTVTDMTGQEDKALRLTGLGGALRDTDKSETLSFVLSGLPKGATLNTGSKQSDGSWRLTPAQLATVSLTPPAQFSGSFALTLTAVATEGADGAAPARTAASFTVSLDPVVDEGSISGSATGKEDTAIVLRVTFSTVDGDGSETWAAVSRISDVPAGATLNLGTQVSPGVWDVPTADLRAGRVSILPPANDDVDFYIKITTVLTDTGNGKSVSRSVTGSLGIGIYSVADAPLVTVADAAGQEDRAVGLQLSAALTDLDGSERIDLQLLGVPPGATLSRGSRNADGSWSLAPGDLAGLTLTPATDFSGTIKLTLRTTVTDTNGSTPVLDVLVTDRTFTVSIAGVADAPGLRVGPAAGAEDSAIALRVSGWTTDIDGSERLVGFRIADLPPGAVLRAGGVVLAREADGSVLVAAAAATSLSVTPPADSDRDFVLRVSAISAEPNGSQAESPARALAVRVDAVADAPLLAPPVAMGLEDSPIALDLGGRLRDGDGSEQLSLLVSGLPEGARLSAGTYRGNGAWSLTAAEAQNVSLLPPRDYAGTLVLSVTAVAQERDGGAEARTTAPLTVQVGAVVDRPAVGGLDGVSGDFGHATGDEDRPIALRLDPGLSDSTGSEHLVGAVTLAGVPAGAVLRLADGTVVAAGPDERHSIEAARIGGLTLTLPRDSDAAVRLTVRMTVEDTGGMRQTIGGTLLVDPQGVADTPLLAVRDVQAVGHDGQDAAAGWVALPIEAQLADTDGSESLHLWVRDVPEGFLLSAGTPAGDGVWRVPADAVAGLAIRPPAGFSGGLTLRIEATASEREGGSASATRLLHIEVSDGGGPVIPGAMPPPVLAAAGEAGLEDSSSALHIALSGGGAGAMLGLRVAGLPAGAMLSAGLRDPESGDWVLTRGELDGLRLTPPADFSGTLSLVLHGVAVSPEGVVLETRQVLDVPVAAVADAAQLGAAPGAGREDTPVALHLSAQVGDADGSESLISVLLSGLPAGARIAAGTGITDHGDGTWSVAPAQLGEVLLLPPAHAAGSFALTMTATTREAGGATRETARQVMVVLEAVPDAPLASAASVAGQEDTAIALRLGAGLVDTDGSERLSLTLEGLPLGSVLSAGLNNGDGTWTLTPGQLAGLTLTPPGNWSGSMALALVAHAMEDSNGAVASTRVAFQVTVAGVADAPLVDAPEALRGDEDTVLALDLRAQLQDRDGSESLSAVFTGVPAGGRFTAGSANADGSWTVPGTALEGLGFVPPPHYSGTLRLGLTVLATEAAGGSTGPSMEIVVTVRPVADAPLLTLGNAMGREDSAVALPIGAALVDTDGSEQLSRVVITGVPDGAKLSAGTRLGDGSWVLQPGQLEGLSLTPVANYAGRLSLGVTAVSVEAATGTEASSSGTLSVTVAPVADAPLLTAAAASGTEDRAVPLALTATLGDSSEQFAGITLGGLPQGFALSAGTALGGGVWQLRPAELAGLTLTPAADWHGTLTLTLQATSLDSAAGLSDSASATRDFSVTIAPVNDAPVLGLAAAAAEPGGLHEAQAFASVAVADVDSARLAGATITLGHGQAGDILALEGLGLRLEGGRMMIGETGIEVVGQGYDAASGSLVLRGGASPAAYQAVLQALVLENAQAGGLTPGTRDIQVTLRDEAGAASLPQGVALVVAALPTEAAPRSFIGTVASESMTGGAGADLFILGPHGGHDSIDGGSGGWTDRIEVTGAGGLHDPQAGWTLVVETPGVVVTETAHGVQFDQPTAGHIQFADGSQADFVHIERIGWS